MTGPKRATEKQLAANRANAQKSTGPRTAEGKAISRRNALKHGILAAGVVTPALERYESQEDYDALEGALRQELQPEGPLEAALVTEVVDGYWRLKRVLRAEAWQVVALEEEWARARAARRRAGREGRAAGAAGLQIAHLLRYESRLHRQIARALSALESLQSRRRSEAVPPPLSAGVTLDPARPEG